jgi:hypothetical protein
MKYLKLYLKSAIVLIISYLHVETGSASEAITVSLPLCHYELRVPEGWDTIPQQVLINRLKQKIDGGIYPISQEDYFSGNYSLISFIPTVNRLDKFTFDQIVADIRNANQQSEINNDTLHIHFDHLQNDLYRIHSFFSVQRNADRVWNCQTLYPSKFGYVSVLSYEKSGAMPINELLEQLSDMIRIQPEYRYSEPKKGITVKHILVSLCIGLIVYGLITVLPKLKKRAS